MDDDVIDEHLETDADSFGEWIKEVAASRDMSEDEFLHQLMSSYWMMDELAAVIDDLEIEPGRNTAERRSGSGSRRNEQGPPIGSPADHDEPEPESNQGGASEPRRSKAEVDDGVIPLIETLKDWKSERDQPDSSTVDQNLVDLIRVIQQGNRSANAEPSESTARAADQAGLGSGDVNETVQLIRALKEFSEPSGSKGVEEQLKAERKYRELSEEVEQLKAELDTMGGEVEQIDLETEERTSELAAQLEQVSNRLDGLDSIVAATPESSQVEKLEMAIEDLADQHTSLQNEVDSRLEEVEAEFQDVERILNHLFDQMDEQATETETLADQVSSVQTRLQLLDDLEAVGKLKRKANRAGVSAATCESCGESVALGQLTKPECPHCNTEFDDLASEKKWGIISRYRLTQSGSQRDG